ncbi:hypothetical protein KFE25_013918 [Diacronema lutheri]|uniref:SKI-interacting protein SKIP SNW domain-containing protein n=2 Tax=Diacronema lutheri TaxID=2081491 RepID=A0A8J5XK21_DIALT|nr:hypothetical protein KFE25_013918 [Diacronema lutheri]
MAMQGLAAILPAPVGAQQPLTLGAAERSAKPPPKDIPPYGERKGWKPRSQDDFADGGAFPEVHVAQYPLDMGRKGKAGSQVVALTTDGAGTVKYDAIARVGQRDSTKVYTSLSDLREHGASAAELARPDDEQLAATTAATKEALDSALGAQQAASGRMRGLPQTGKAAERAAPTFIRYTPSEGGGGNVQGRVIRMVEAAKDPLEPPKFKQRRVPNGPPSPPAPVMHSPERKLTAEDRAAWKIPPCVSSWKNAKGYTVPLDKRLAADGRGLQAVQISDNFAKLSESLYIAERAAREEVERRSQLQKKLAMREKASKEDELRLLAQRARAERAAALGDRPLGAPPPPPPPPGGPSGGAAAAHAAHAEDDAEDDAETLALAAEREELRRERKRERERERRLEGGGAAAVSGAGGGGAGGGDEGAKRSKQGKERERDISEKIALGQAAPTGGESLYDQRLFNQSQGMASGLGGDEDAYNIYDKALFAQTSAGALYRPKRSDADGWGGDEDAVAAQVERGARFRPDRGFAGTEGGGGGSARGGGPVAFEEEHDPFGLEHMVSEAERAKRTER